MSKKFITWLFIIIILGILFFLVYFLFFTNYRGQEIRPDRDRDELYNPFGDAFPVPDFEGDSDFDTDFSTDMVSKLKQITTVPVSGFDIFYTEDLEDEQGDVEIQPNQERQQNFSELDKTYFRYVERATGHVYETSYNSESNTRISNVTIPKSHESMFINNGDQIIYRFIDGEDSEILKTYVSNFNYNTASGFVADIFSSNNSEGFFLINNITHLIKSLNGDLFSLVTRKVDGAFRSVGFIINKEDFSNIDVIIDSEVSEWVPQWIDENFVSLTNSASYNSDGFSFKLNIDNGRLERVIGPFRGLTTNYSPDGRYVILSISNGSGYMTYVYDINNSLIRKTFLNTVAEKCAWTSDSTEFYCGGLISLPNEMPDLWYKGALKFNDILISHSMEDFRFKAYNEYNRNLIPNLDVINLKISERGDYLLFQNKTDLTLWAYDLI